MSENTHNPPRANISINATFCLLGISIDARAGIGIIKMAMSVVMCMAALENHNAGLFKQNPSIVGSQNLATGMQFKNALITAQVP